MYILLFIDVYLAIYRCISCYLSLAVSKIQQMSLMGLLAYYKIV